MHWNRVIRTWHLALILIAVSLGPRAALLLTTERTPDADECIVGLMALHVSRGERPPVFFYGQHYGGGHVIEALAAAPWFSRAGVSEVAVQAVPAAFSVALALLVFLWMGRAMGWGVGFFCALALSFSTPFLKSSFKADGYVETMFLGVLSFYLFERMTEAGARTRSLLYAAAIGFILGLAWWSYDFGLIYLGTLVLAGFARRGRVLLYAAAVWLALGLAWGSYGFGLICLGALVLIVFAWLGRIPQRALPLLFICFSLVVFAACFAVGASLLIYDNIAHDFENIRHLLYGRPREAPLLEHAAAVGLRLVRGDFAAFLTRNCLHNFEWDAVPLSSWVYAALAAFGAAVSFVGRRELKLPATVFLFPAMHLLLYLVSPHGGLSPRYLLPLEPFISIYLVGAAVYFLRGSSLFSWAAGAAMFACVAAALAFGYSSIRSDDSIVEGNVHTDKRSITEVIGFLDSKEIDCVLTTYFIKWRILFETRERINAVDIVANRRRQEFSRYEDRGCPSSTQLTFVIHKRSEMLPKIIYSLSGRGADFGYHHTTDHMIVYVK